ncbi:MAG TPA: hypothetical protein VFU30_15205 [Gaiellaceae bacterium]|nr:hypothetical protein [Gaiellaceae bacterium]
MKRFLTLVAVAAVAGAMYVAAAPGSHQTTGPTAAQFARLKKQVATLNKNLTALKKDEKAVKAATIAAVDYIAGCFLDTNGNIEHLGVTEFGDTTTGYLFGTAPGGVPTGVTPHTALTSSGTAPAAYLQEVTPACVTSATAAATTAHSSSRLERWAKDAH